MRTASRGSGPVGRASLGPRLRGAPTAWAILSLVSVIAFGAYLRFVSTRPLPLDSWWHDLVEVSRGSLSYAVAVALADAGSAIGAGTCGAILAALLIVLRRRREAAAVAFALVAGVLCSELIKSLVLRPRPSDAMYTALGQSYPSGHSMGAAALLVSAAMVVAATESASASVTRAAYLGAAGIVVVMMWSRTALHVHWLTDTLAGALLGTSIAILSRRLWVRRVPPPA